MSFREQFIEIIQKLNLSDEDCARIAGTSRPTIARWRTGQTEPHPIMQQTILRMFQGML